MTLQLYSQDLPYLKQIEITQVRNGFFENILPYAPLFGTIISVIAAIWIAQKAREITADQKRIAQDKLDFDIFEKRFAIINSLAEMYNILVHAKNDRGVDNLKDTRSSFMNYYIKTEMSKLIFEESDSTIIISTSIKLNKMFAMYYASKNFTDSFKYSNENRNYTASEALESFCTIDEEVLTLLRTYSLPLYEKYTPINLRKPPAFTERNVPAYPPTTTTSPASPDKPQPTAPAADQSPPIP